MTRWPPNLIACLVTLAFGLPPGLAASVELKVSSHELYVNEQTTIYLAISDFQTYEPPPVPTIPNCRVGTWEGPQDRSERLVVNGRVVRDTREHLFALPITPLKPGPLFVPPIQVEVDGELQKTRDARLRVLPSETDKYLQVEIDSPRKRVYVGQKVNLILRVWVRRPGSTPWGVFNPAEYVYRQLDRSQMGPFDSEVDRFERRIRTSEEGSPTYFVYEFDAEFIPSRSGQLAFDDIEIGVVYPTQRGERHLRARPDTPPIEVLPIPMDGRPANFNGAVGLFDIEVSANPLDVRVGDPIELTIDIFGEGPVDTLPPPLLSANATLNQNFRVPDQARTGEMHNGRRRFTVTIRARRDAITEIPAIEYPYFDPDAERFVIARSDPIPLNVAPAAVVEAPELIPPDGSPANNTDTPLQALDGLHDIETSEAVLLQSTTYLSPRWIDGLLFAPPIGFLLAWIATGAARQWLGDPARRRRQLAARSARQRIREASQQPPRELGATISTALAEYLADRLDQPPARFMGRAALEPLQARGVSSEVQTKWTRVIEQCEQTAFGGASPETTTSLPPAALACIDALERERL